MTMTLNDNNDLPLVLLSERQPLLVNLNELKIKLMISKV